MRADHNLLAKIRALETDVEVENMRRADHNLLAKIRALETDVEVEMHEESRS